MLLLLVRPSLARSHRQRAERKDRTESRRGLDDRRSSLTSPATKGRRSVPLRGRQYWKSGSACAAKAGANPHRSTASSCLARRERLRGVPRLSIFLHLGKHLSRGRKSCDGRSPRGESSSAGSESLHHTKRHSCK